ncbi:MAG: hypothetical protein GY757_21515, partial [bacterium]|nr:hypothetical protein [bacterium]
RTSFHMITPLKPPPPNNQSPITNNQPSPVQVIHDYGEIDFAIREVREGGASFFRPFDLTQAPLLRVGVTRHQGKHRLLVDMHHIITDGVSQELLVKELVALKAGESLTPLTLQYKDYAQWRSSGMHNEILDQQEKYWLTQLSGELPVLRLPTDYPRPEIQRFEGNTVPVEFTKEETGKLKETAKENKATLYMTIQAIFSIMLSKLSGQQDIIIGMPTAGRSHAALEKIVGMFVNTLALRNYPEGKKTFTEFLTEVKKNTLKAFENQEYQFEDLVNKLSVRRDTARNPIFDVIFNLLTQSNDKKKNTSPVNSSNLLNPLNLLNSSNTLPGAESIAKFDLTLSAIETGDSLVFDIEYATKLFKEETIKRFITYFKQTVQTILDDPGQKISEIEIITQKEKNQILYEFNDTTAEYPGDKTIHQLFEEQVASTPDNISVVGREKTVGSRQYAVGKEKIK